MFAKQCLFAWSGLKSTGLYHTDEVLGGGGNVFHLSSVKFDPDKLEH